MPRGKKLTQALREEIVAAYLADESKTYGDLAETYGVSVNYVGKLIRDNIKAGNGIKPDRRRNTVLRRELLSDAELDRKHEQAEHDKAVEAAKKHPRTSDWMEHVKPLHQRKAELERAIEHKQAELEKAKQEYRDFLATLKQLLEEAK